MRFVGGRICSYSFIVRFQDRPLTVTNHRLLELHVQFSFRMTITHEQVAGMISQLPGLND